ncbi:dephospho-CoA kinase [Niabella aquatica]
MLKIGLTGGIGSGKTTIAKIFSTLGIPVYDADSAAKLLMHTHDEIRQQLTATFGKDTFKNNQLNRAYLAGVVFGNEEKLRKLNAITHPVTIQDSINWFNRQTAPYAIKEAALIFESGSNEHLDYTIGVWAPRQLRAERILLRGELTEPQIYERMARQMNEEQKMQLCDFVIKNDGTSSVLQQVFRLHQQIKKLAGS